MQKPQNSEPKIIKCNSAGKDANWYLQGCINSNRYSMSREDRKHYYWVVSGSVNEKQIKCKFILKHKSYKEGSTKGLITAKYLFWLKQLMESTIIWLYVGNFVFWGN